MKIRAMLLASALIFAAGAANAGVTFTVTGTSGANPAGMAIGEFMTVDVRISSDGEPAIFGLGASAYGYDTNFLSFDSGDAVVSYLHDTCIPAPTNVCFNGLDNVEGGALTAEADGRIQIGNSASLTGRVGTGDLDPGLDGAVGGDDAQFRLVFEAIAEGTSTLTVGTGANQGDVIVLAGGVTEQATNDTLVITVPEPGAVVSGLAALGSVLAVVGIRRKA